MSGWCTIESDPAVLTEMLERFGIAGVTVEELVALDADELTRVAAGGKVFGLIFLFKWTPDRGRGRDSDAFSGDTSHLYFAQQVVENACATQALLNTVFNFPNDLPQGLGQLADFYSFTKELDPSLRGESIGGADNIREVHNSFARPVMVSVEDDPRSRKADAFHFTSFIVKNGCVYELDGLKAAPMKRAENATGNNALTKLTEVVLGRIQEISREDITFSVCAVVEDPVLSLKKQVAEKLAAEQPAEDIKERIAAIEMQREKGKKDNIRRRHNYLPALIELFKALHTKGKLKGIMEEAVALESQRRPTQKHK